ncbi:Uncharacterised protein [Vibrio cholerae]|uniref:Uncharacterized protein n=1 Tax=Vibrio cholerae TaxID=666 RepID=A0A655ZP93_VIBCL|nr:Uncharacterised protein [Vibrio cholerae]
MYSVAKRVEDRRQIVGNPFWNFECVKRWDHQIFRETTGAVYAHTNGVATQVRAATTAVTTVTASDVTFTRNAITQLETTHFLANANHFTHVFVADDHRYGNGFL